MGKKRASTRQGDDIEVTRMEKRQKKRQDKDSPHMVNSNLSSLFKNEDRMQMYNEKFKEREVLEYKHVDFENLVKLYENQEVDVANYLATHMWTDFVQVHRPVNKTLVRILISNLDTSNMISWIGQIKVDLSEVSWNNYFEMIHVSEEEEESLMQMSKEDVFHRLTGERNLGMVPFIRINQLHQEANVRLAAQIVMNVLIPKKGSKEQVKVEEGRLLYAMIYGKPINLARMIVERLKAACGRKSSPICYGMHLMEIMEKAGVDLKCTRTDTVKFNSVIDHHTLKRLGYKLGVGSWEYVGKGQAQAERREEQAFEEEPSQPHQVPSSTTHPTPPRPRPTSILSDQLAHLQQFIFEQLNLQHAQIHAKLDRMEAKLDTMDSRIQNLEAHLLPPSSPHATHDPSDPKGKRPMESPHPTSPVHISSHSSSSSSSSSQTAAQFELAAREPTSPTSKTPTPSSDSEATPSPPKQTSSIPSPPKESSPPLSEPNPIPSPPHSPPPKEPSPPKSSPPHISIPPSSPTPQPISEPIPEIPPQPIPESTPPPTSTSQAIIPYPPTTRPTYQRRKLAVTRPKTTTPLVPFPPPSPPASP